jgi:hypothetical protein
MLPLAWDDDIATTDSYLSSPLDEFLNFVYVDFHNGSKLKLIRE